MATYEIKDYVEQAKREPTTENIEALWRSVFFRKAWYFLPSRDDEGPAFPTVTEIDGAPWLLAFTGVRRLKAFARQVGRVDDDGSVPVLALDPGESMSKIFDFDDDLAGVVFNIDSEATFRAPVEALAAYVEHFDVPVDQNGW